MLSRKRTLPRYTSTPTHPCHDSEKRDYNGSVMVLTKTLGKVVAHVKVPPKVLDSFRSGDNKIPDALETHSLLEIVDGGVGFVFRGSHVLPPSDDELWVLLERLADFMQKVAVDQANEAMVRRRGAAQQEHAMQRREALLRERELIVQQSEESLSRRGNAMSEREVEMSEREVEMSVREVEMREREVEMRLHEAMMGVHENALREREAAVVKRQKTVNSDAFHLNNY
jgi:hypothetical protein